MQLLLLPVIHRLVILVSSKQLTSGFSDEHSE